MNYRKVVNFDVTNGVKLSPTNPTVNLDLTVQGVTGENEEDVLHLSLTLNQAIHLVRAFDEAMCDPLMEQIHLEQASRS